jgi:hypothetical protein
VTVEITILPSFDDYLAAHWLVFRKSWLSVNLTKYVVTFFAFILAIQLLIYGFKGAGFAKFALWAWVCSSLMITGVWFGILALTQAINLPRSLRESYYVSQTIIIPTTYTFTNEGILIHNDRVTANYDWPIIVCAMENNKFLIFLTHSWKQMFLLPKAQLDFAALVDLRAALVAAEVPTR